MKQKLKVLMVSEASYLSSGFGTYAKEVLSRLHKTDKYIIAEFASYGTVNDPRDVSIDWIYYANAVSTKDPRHKEYSQKNDNQFGRWRFEKVLIDFKPDVVIDVRDYWMSAYQQYSPLRKYFHWILMPTVDSAPQQEGWLDTFIDADAIFTYSDWGANVLNQQTSNHINYINTASPGVNLDVFNIKENRASIKQQFGFEKDSFIIGSVMRNQKRKLIPELFISYRKLLDKLSLENPEIASKLCFYFHTSYPDMGWDIPELLKKNRLANKVYFTYICRQCKNIRAIPFVGAKASCPNCFNNSCFMPSVAVGVSQSQLSNIYNLFDLYVQYAICEGFGMPQVEAGACGVPIITVNYSAMCDIVKKLDAIPIQPQCTFVELETKANRVYPNNDQLVDEIIKFINLPDSIQYQKRFKTRQLTEKYYDWANTAKTWEKYLDKLDAENYRSNWNKIDQHYQNININDASKIDSSQYFDVLIKLCKHINNIDYMSTYSVLDILSKIDNGFELQGMMPKEINDAKILFTYFDTFIKNHNITQNILQSKESILEDFIHYAKLKNETK